MARRPAGPAIGHPRYDRAARQPGSRRCRTVRRAAGAARRAALPRTAWSAKPAGHGRPRSESGPAWACVRCRVPALPRLGLVQGRHGRGERRHLEGLGPLLGHVACPTRPVSARGRSCSIGLIVGAEAARPRAAPLRAAGGDARVTRGLGGRRRRRERRGFAENGSLTRGSRSLRPAVPPAREEPPPGRPDVGAVDHRAGTGRSVTGLAGRPAAVVRPAPVTSTRLDGENPPPAPARAGPVPGPLPAPGRGGIGCASRLSSEVSAQIARNVSGMMNWSRNSSLILVCPWSCWRLLRSRPRRERFGRPARLVHREWTSSPNSAIRASICSLESQGQGRLGFSGRGG